MTKQIAKNAYGQISVKTLNDELWEFDGIATSISTDRDGDIVDSTGAEFKLPIPLLWQHDRNQPIGSVIAANVTDTGIQVRAKLVKPTGDMPSHMSSRLTEAWESIKTGLVRGLSIGFKPIEYSFMDSGVRYSKWGWNELSAVTIPSNQDASIMTIKSLDESLLSASGKESDKPPGKPPDKPGVSGKSSNPPIGGFFYAQNKRMDTKMNVSDQIMALELKRKELSDERTTIQTKAVDEGRTKDASEAERFAEITAEINAVDKELADLRVMEKDLISSAKKVDGSTEKTANESRNPGHIQVRDNRVVGKGLALAQMAKFIAKAQGNYFGAQQLAVADQNADPRVANVLKAAVAAGSTLNTSWAGNLVGDETSVYADFIEYLRPLTIIGSFGSGNVPGLRTVPFRVPLVGQTSGGAGYWVGEGKGKPLTKFDFSRTTLEPLKVANIAVLTEEVIRYSSPSADAIVRDQLVAVLRERLDVDFIAPSKAAVAGVSPASITNGLTAITSAGNDADAVRADIKVLFGAFIAANNAPTTGVYIMSATTALALSLMLNPLGQPEFPGVTMNGGTLLGLPIIVSEYVTGGLVILVNASDIYLGDEGGFQIDLSREASLVMDDAQATDSTTPTATQTVSMFQTNSVAFRAERVINWAKRRASAVAYLSGVEWGTEEEP
jgi:HK97 family phage major capsid protein/HK97 family phage prohead protease